MQRSPIERRSKGDNVIRSTPAQGHVGRRYATYVAQRMPILSTTRKPQPFFVSPINIGGERGRQRPPVVMGRYARKNQYAFATVDTRVIQAEGYPCSAGDKETMCVRTNLVVHRACGNETWIESVKSCVPDYEQDRARKVPN